MKKMTGIDAEEPKHLLIAFKDDKALICVIIGTKKYEIEVEKKELFRQLNVKEISENGHNEIYI